MEGARSWVRENWEVRADLRHGHEVGAHGGDDQGGREHDEAEGDDRAEVKDCHGWSVVGLLAESEEMVNR